VMAASLLALLLVLSWLPPLAVGSAILLRVGLAALLLIALLSLRAIDISELRLLWGAVSGLGARLRRL
jgi:hypothetical protein